VKDAIMEWYLLYGERDVVLPVGSTEYSTDVIRLKLDGFLLDSTPTANIYTLKLTNKALKLIKS